MYLSIGTIDSLTRIHRFWLWNGGMRVSIGGLIQLPCYCVGVSFTSMGPSRHSLRIAARNVVGTLSSKTSAGRFTTPRGFSNISEARLKLLGFLRSESESEAEELSGSSDDKLASEEFNLREHQSLNLDDIKRQLKFSSPKAATMNDDVHFDRGTGGNVGARTRRVKVKLEADDDVVKESRPTGRRNSKPKLVAVKIEKAEQGKEDHKVNLIGVVKQEPKEEETLISSGQQNTEIDDIVKAEPREKAGPRRRKVQSNVLSRVTKLKVEKDQQKEDSKKEQGSPQVISRPKRKLSEQRSSGATPSMQASDSKKSSKVTNGAAPGLQIISVRSGSEVQLASEIASSVISLPGPFPSYSRPFPEECQQAKDLLSALHGHLPEYERPKVSCPTVEQHIYVQRLQPLDPSGPLTKTQGHPHAIKSGPKEVAEAVNKQLGVRPVFSEEGFRPKDVVPKGRSRDRRGGVLDSLIGTLLSQNTTDNNSRRAFASLKKSFPTWEEVLRANPKDVEDAIRPGGLAEIKAERIRTILGTLLKERGEISMEYIRNMSNEDIKVELSRFKGVGPKTVACVLLFHLQRKEFPVDTHVFRISKMLGWVPEQADREKAYLHLNQRIPDSLKFDIHCLFVTHGKRCPKCAKRFNRQPSDGECPLLNWKSRWSSSIRQAPLELEYPGLAINL